MRTKPIFDPSTDGAARALTRDHARLDGIMDEVRSMIADGELERAEYVYRDFLEGLARHVRAEEELLFPALEQHPLMQGPTSVMRAEHQRLISLAAALEHALDAERGEQARAVFDALTTLIASHNHKEERVLYPRADEALSAADRAALLAELKQA